MKKEDIDLNEISDGLVQVYNSALPLLDRAQKLSTCTKGCTWCCYQLVAVSLPEGAVMAREVLKRPDWKRIARDMAARAKQSKPDEYRANYLYKKLPCPLLDLKEKTCRVYDTRPSACRFFFAVKDPALCHPDNANIEVPFLDMGDQEKATWDYARAVLDGPMPLSSPLSVMVLYCMAWLVEEDAKKLKYMKTVVRGVKTPYEWMGIMLKHFETFVGERTIQQEIEKMGNDHELVSKDALVFPSPQDGYRGRG